MLLLIAIIASPHAKAVATASVRIERPVSASKEDWERLPESRRREIFIRDELGRTIVLRLFENQ